MYKMAAWLSLLSVVLGCLLECSLAGGCSEKERLVRALTKSYVKSVEPESSPIQIGLSFLCSKYDRTTGQLSTIAWERYSWTDSRLRWEPKDYDGIEVLRIPPELIWTPDFRLYNSLKATEDRGRTNTVVRFDGGVLWVPPVTYQTLCSNEQTGNGLSCDFVIGSWTYDADAFRLELIAGQSHDLSAYLNSTCPLSVQRGSGAIRTKQYACCKEPYSTLEVNLRLRPSN